MKHLLCASVNRVLEAYHDGELPVEEQIVVETHLSECYLCASEAKSLRMVRDALRASAEVPADAPVFVNSRQTPRFTARVCRAAADGRGQAGVSLDAQLASMSSAVISRVKAERAQSLPSRIARLFEDLHLVWAALAATTATATAAAIVAGVLYFAPKERSDSLAGVLSALAAPGSDRNPMVLDKFIAPPRFEAEPIIENMPLTTEGTDVMLAVSGVVTQDGRLAFPSLVSASPYSQAEDRRVMDKVSGDAVRARHARRRACRRQLRVAPRADQRARQGLQLVSSFTATRRRSPRRGCLRMSLRYEQFAPAGELHTWVECYWRLTGAAGLAPHPQRILPDGYVEIILHLGDPFLRVDEGTAAVRQARFLFAGQMIRPVRVMATGRTCVWGIRLHPWAAAAVAGMPASELTGRIEDAEAVCPRLVEALTGALIDATEASELARPRKAPQGDVTSEPDADGAECVRALDRILMRHVARAAPLDPLVVAAGRLLLREPRPIADVARRMGVSPRHLTRAFRHAVGLTPKMFARISRFQRVAAVLDDGAGRDAGGRGARLRLLRSVASGARRPRVCRRHARRPARRARRRTRRILPPRPPQRRIFPRPIVRAWTSLSLTAALKVSREGEVSR